MAPSSIVPQPDEARAHSTMMAWLVHEFGPPEVMKFESVPRPEPGPGEILVKVAAAGVGPWDGWIRGGKSALPQPLPLTPRPRPASPRSSAEFQSPPDFRVPNPRSQRQSVPLLPDSHSPALRRAHNCEGIPAFGTRFGTSLQALTAR